MSKTRARSKKGDIHVSRSGSTGAEADSAARRATEFLDSLLPETDKPSGTNFSDRQLKRATLHDVRNTQKRAVAVFDGIEKTLEADSENRDRWEAQDEHLTKQRESDERARENHEVRENIRLALEIGERQTASRDTSRERHLFMALTTISVFATIALALISTLNAEPLLYGGSLLGFLLSGGGVYRLRALTSQSSDEEDDGAGAEEPENAVWGGLGIEDQTAEEQG